MTKLTLKQIVWRVLVLALASLLVFTVLASAQNVRYGGTLKVVEPWGSFTRSSNPFPPAGGQKLPGTNSLVYEYLFFINNVTGEEVPVLGVSYTWSKGNLELTVKTRQGVLWSDGKPFSARDVAFTFNYLKKYPALDINGLWAKTEGLEQVKAVDDHTVVFSFSKVNTPLFRSIASQAIVPEHIWSKIDNPVTYVNENPIGTGPFLLKSSSPQSAIYVKNPNYWMKGRPYIDKVVYQAVKSNDTGLLMMLRDEADVSYLYIPDVVKTFVARNPKVHHYWWPVTNDNILYFNTAKKILDQPAFRKAVGMALDKDLMAKRVYYGAVSAADPSGIIPAQQGEWLDADLKAAYSYDPQGAKQVLQKAGFTWDAQGNLLGPNGETLPTFKILVGAGWTDYISMAQIISQNLTKLGIHTSIDQEPFSSYMASLMSGTYDTAICWGTGSGPTPYYFYYRELSPQFSASKIGENAASDYTRFTDPKVTQALAAYRATSDPVAQHKAITTIVRVVVSQVPFVPLNGRMHFLVYNESRFIGWPSAKNPYNDASAMEEIGALFMYLNVHLK